MKNPNANLDETESDGGTMIHLNFREWILAPQFEYLSRAPAGEAEVCDTLSLNSVVWERHHSKGRNANRFLSTAFSSLDDFKKNLVAGELLFFHVYAGDPSDIVLKLLSECGKHERLLLLDVGNDLGFLRNTPVTVAITAPPREFVSKPLADLRGLGAWAKGTLVGFEEDDAEMASFIAKARSFGHPPK